jgi:hypothetical protein
MRNVRNIFGKECIEEDSIGNIMGVKREKLGEKVFSN